MLKKSEPELNKNTKNNFIDYTSLNDKHKRRFTLSHHIVILITLVVCIALLPASLFTTYRVSKVIYDRVSINAVRSTIFYVILLKSKMDLLCLMTLITRIMTS